MAAYTDHLYCEVYPYVSPSELCCKAAEEMEPDDDRILDAIDDASMVVYYLTGKQFGGTCQATVRPGCLSSGCHCGCTPNQVNIGLWPVTDLISVRYDGTLYTGTALTDTFHINEYRYLARNDGEAFLTGNQWAVAGGSEDTVDNGHTFEITVSYGLSAPRLIKRAVKALACRWIEQCCGQTGPCKLPERTTSVSRSGISMDIASATDLLAKGRTGIYEVDLAVQVFNPSALQSPSFVWNAQTANGGGRKI